MLLIIIINNIINNIIHNIIHNIFNKCFNQILQIIFHIYLFNIFSMNAFPLYMIHQIKDVLIVKKNLQEKVIWKIILELTLVKNHLLVVIYLVVKNFHVIGILSNMKQFGFFSCVATFYNFFFLSRIFRVSRLLLACKRGDAGTRHT